jgi:hypothetical protein
MSRRKPKTPGALALVRAIAVLEHRAVESDAYAHELERLGPQHAATIDGERARAEHCREVAAYLRGLS